MEIQLNLTSDLLDVQGILSRLSAACSVQFTNIKYRGGNEMVINLIINAIEDFLLSKNYLVQRETNVEKMSEIKDIVLYLTLNTDFTAKSTLYEPSIFHLTNMCPKLSKCILANLITQLKLAEAYSKIFAMLPLALSAEMLPEVIICLRKSAPVVLRIQSFIYLKEIVDKLSTIDSSTSVNSRYFQTIEDASMQILLYLSQFNIDQAEGFTKSTLYEHIGLIILGLSEVMLRCQIGTDTLARLMDNLIRTTCTVYKSVTLDVFIEWAEYDLDEISLQQRISFEAYRVTERYNKYKPAKELIQMFSTIAKKPPTLNDTILLSSTSTMVAKVNNISDLKVKQQWFTAMLNTGVFDEEEVMLCLDKWYKLCTLDDVVRILDSSVRYDNEPTRKLAIKCAGGLETDDLNIAIIRYYREHGIKKTIELSDTTSNLTLLMNKIFKSTNTAVIHEILLLLLQNIKFVTEVLISECIKNNVFSSALETIFGKIKDVIIIENLTYTCLAKCFNNNKVTEENLGNYIELIKVLITTECIRKEDELLFSVLKKQFEEDLKEDMSFTLRIINGTSISKFSADISTMLLKMLNKFRCKFFDFSHLKMNICKEVIQILQRNPISHNTEVDEECEVLTIKFNLFYTNLEQNTRNGGLLHFIYPNFYGNNYSESVSKIIKILPSCVLCEWLWISNSLQKLFGVSAFLDMFTDFMLLICQVATSVQSNKEQVRAALQFCVSNYGIVIKKTILIDTHKDDMILQQAVVKKICLLINHIMPDVQSIEGFHLICLLDNEILKSLKSDEEFLIFIDRIDNDGITKAIAQKMNA